MNTKIFMLSLVIACASLKASDENSKKHAFGYAAHQIYKAVTRADAVVGKVGTVVGQADALVSKVPSVAHKAGSELVQGAVSQRAGMQVLGSDFGSGVLEGLDKKAKEKGTEYKNVVMGAGAALMATWWGPGVIAAGVGVLAVGTTAHQMTEHRARGFRRCLNTNFSGELNERGFPKRCESPERRYAWWVPEESVKEIEHYRKERVRVEKLKTMTRKK